MPILKNQNGPFFNEGKLYAVELWITDYGFDYQFREAHLIAKLNETIAEDAAVDTSNPTHVGNSEYCTETSAVFGPITDRVAVRFDSLRERTDFSDRASYSLPITFNGIFANRYDLSSPRLSKDQQLTNITAATAASKEHPIEWHGTMIGTTFITVQVPLTVSPNSDWIISVHLPDKDLLRVSPEQPMLEIFEKTAVPNRYLPLVKFVNNTATVTAEGTVDLAFYLFDPISNSAITDKNTKVYLKTYSGRLSKQVVQTVNGAGTVKLIAEYLEAGDEVKVSCGFKYFSGTDDCLITVV